MKIVARQCINLNYNWYFCEQFDDKHIKDYLNTSSFEKVDLPHNAVEVPYHYFDEKKIQGEFTYKKEIFIEESYQGKILSLIFEGVSVTAHLFINDEFVMTHKGAYTPFTACINEFVQYGATNMITVVVDSHENVFIPPFGGLVDYLVYSGIYREVQLEIKEPSFIETFFLRSYHPLQSNSIHIDATLSTDEGVLQITVLDQKIEKIKTQMSIQSKDMKCKIDVMDKVLWELDQPYLYEVKLQLFQNNILMDEVISSFGFREIKTDEQGIILNGKRRKLRGLNRHQSYPYVGYAMPKSAQEKDAVIIKNDLGVQIVRTSHYPPSKHFIQKCDEIGLLVMEEIPGWQTIGNAEWQELTVKNTEDMILRDRNHPSIIMWGVRINESADNHDLYVQTNAIAHRLDDSRPTAGVRNIAHSEFLEDIYTYNDFSFSGKNRPLAKKNTITKKKHPYIISEYNGHMFPCKRFDVEEWRIEHALRHLKVINVMQKPKNGIGGAIGWCLFDYQTHQEFGSGDRICYHGVLDFFRHPKLASYAYSSQQDEHVVLEASSLLQAGDYPASNLENVIIFTNCEYVKLYKNNDWIGDYYPDRKHYQYLNHPPIIINDFIGNLLEKQEHFTKRDSRMTKKAINDAKKFGTRLPFLSKLRFLYLMMKYHLTYEQGLDLFYKYTVGTHQPIFRIDGYQKNEKAASITMGVSQNFSYHVELESLVLRPQETYDVTKITIKKTDEWGRLLVYAFEDVMVQVEGAIDLIGPNTVPLIGGIGSFWIKSNTQKGLGKIEINLPNQIIIETVEVKS